MTQSAWADLALQLAGIGLEKRAGMIFTAQIAPHVIGWVGINRASRLRPMGEVEVNPVIGIRDQRIERVVAELRGERFHPYEPPTVSVPLRYLMPVAHQGWVFSVDRPDLDIADLVASIGGYGLPFMKSGADFNVLCEYLDDGMGFVHQLVYRRPVALALAGRASDGARLIESGVADLGGRQDAAAVELRAFAFAFQERYGVSSSG